MADYTTQVREQVQKQYQAAEDWASVQLRTANDLAALNTATAFEVAGKALNAVRALTSASDRVVEEALQVQRSLSGELNQVAQGYANSVKDLVGAAIR